MFFSFVNDVRANFITVAFGLKVVSPCLCLGAGALSGGRVSLLNRVGNDDRLMVD